MSIEPNPEADSVAKRKAKSKKEYSLDPHRLLPQSPDSEKGLISSFLIAPRDLGRICIDKQITPEHFAIPSHAAMFITLMDMWEKNIAIDIITLTEELRKKKCLDQCGGAAYVTELFTYLPTAANAGTYIEILHEKLILREIIKEFTELASRGYDDQDKIPELIFDIQAKSFKLVDAWRIRSAKQARKTNSKVIAEILTDFAARDRKAMYGDPIGFKHLDESIAGVIGGDMVLICGGTSSGKSSFALQWSMMEAARGKRVLYFPFEMNQRQNLTRAIQAEAQRNMLKALTDDQMEFGQEDTDAKIAAAANKIAGYPIEFCDDRAEVRDFKSLRTAAIRRHALAPLGLVVIDYDELIPGGKPNGVSMEEYLASIAVGSKVLAEDLGCPVALLSQVTHDEHGRAHSARCKAKLNSANTALYIELINDQPDRRNIAIWKQRDGSRGGKIRIGFDSECTRFYDVPQNEQENIDANKAAAAKASPKTKGKK